MFSHVMVGSDDIARSKKFYDAVFGAMGGKPAVEDAKGRLIYAHNGGVFMVSKPIDGKSATHANGGTVGFSTRRTTLPSRSSSATPNRCGSGTLVSKICATGRAEAVACRAVWKRSANCLTP